MREYLERLAKYHLAKALGKPDNGRTLLLFQAMVRPETWNNREHLLAETKNWLSKKSQHESPEAYAHSTDPIVREGYALREKTCQQFKNKHANTTGLRVLIHLPDQFQSPGGYSYALNFQQAFSFMGVACEFFYSGSNFKQVIETFKPTMFLTVDSVIHIATIDWGFLKKYRASHELALGIVPQPHEWKEKMPERIAWAASVGVTFFYCFHHQDFVAESPLYQPIRDAGYPIFSLLFGANILEYYPVANIPRDIPYVFLASINSLKSEPYLKYLGTVARKYPGLIDGPGWAKIKNFSFDRDLHRYLYARAKVGVNINLPHSLHVADETNERCYMLAACGTPQVTDAAKILEKLYGPETIFIAHSPAEYRDYFEKIQRDPEMAQRWAMNAMRETFAKHTTFHRIDGFINSIVAAKIIT